MASDTDAESSRLAMRDVPADVPRPVRRLLTNTLVDVFVVKHHTRGIGSLISWLADSPDHKLPPAGINIAVDGHNVAQLEVISIGNIDTNDGGVTLSFKAFKLLPLDNELGIDIEKAL